MSKYCDSIWLITVMWFFCLLTPDLGKSAESYNLDDQWCTSSTESKSTLLIRWNIIWVQSAAQGAKVLDLVPPLITSVFWVLQESNQSFRPGALEYGALLFRWWRDLCCTTCKCMSRSSTAAAVIHWSSLMCSRCGERIVIFWHHQYSGTRPKKYKDVSRRMWKLHCTEMHWWTI